MSTKISDQLSRRAFQYVRSLFKKHSRSAGDAFLQRQADQLLKLIFDTGVAKASLKDQYWSWADFQKLPAPDQERALPARTQSKLFHRVPGHIDEAVLNA